MELSEITKTSKCLNGHVQHGHSEEALGTQRSVQSSRTQEETQLDSLAETISVEEQSPGQKVAEEMTSVKLKINGVPQNSQKIATDSTGKKVETYLEKDESQHSENETMHSAPHQGNQSQRWRTDSKKHTAEVTSHDHQIIPQQLVGESAVAVCSQSDLGNRKAVNYLAHPPTGENTDPKKPSPVNKSYQTATLFLTWIAYVSYHLSRKPISIAKNSLNKNCTSLASKDNFRTHAANDTTWCDWKPFDGSDYEHLFGWLDVGFLGTYAICMFISGYVAERLDLRYFLSVGMICCGISVAMFGVGYFFNIHSFAYYLLVQMVAGGFQSTGWPAVVATVGNWFGPGRRGAIMGIWNSHTSVGNILGALIAGVWANGEWAWSFIVPGIIIASLGIVVFFFLIPHPSDMGLEIQNTRVKRKQDDELSTNTEVSITVEKSPLIHSEDAAISLKRALLLPGVLEFSLCLFFAKLVSYTFLFWLPKYISATTNFSPEKSADLSTLFDVGGVLGGFAAGAVTDYNRSPGLNCVILLILGTPMLFVYQSFGNYSYACSIGLLLICGGFVNGPYALITTAVSAELGTQPALKGNRKALATVTSIIDGTGSIGAAIGPLLTGWISPTGWQNVFYMLIAANILAALLLARIVLNEGRRLFCAYPSPEDSCTEIIPEQSSYVQPVYDEQTAQK